MRPAILALVVCAAGCAWLQKQQAVPVQGDDAVTVEATVAVPASGNPVAPELLDTATAGERAAALAPPTGAETVLGTAIVSLGDVTEPGFWVKSPLVVRPGPGRIEIAATGASAEVTLIPVAEGGTQLSLSAMRALGVGLTDLPEATLYVLPGQAG